jgi:hypothetical protein
MPAECRVARDGNEIVRAGAGGVCRKGRNKLEGCALASDCTRVGPAGQPRSADATASVAQCGTQDPVIDVAANGMKNSRPR